MTSARQISAYNLSALDRRVQHSATVPDLSCGIVMFASGSASDKRDGRRWIRRCRRRRRQRDAVQTQLRTANIALSLLQSVMVVIYECSEMCVNVHLEGDASDELSCLIIAVICVYVVSNLSNNLRRIISLHIYLFLRRSSRNYDVNRQSLLQIALVPNSTNALVISICSIRLY